MKSLRLYRVWWLILCFVFVSGLIVPIVGANPITSPWLISSPQHTKISDVLSSAVPFSLNGNRDCQQREIITRPAKLIPPQSKQSHQGCTVDTGFGSFSHTGYLQRPGSTAFGRVVSSTNTSANMLPIPYSSTGIVAGGGAVNGSYLFFIKDLDQKFSTLVTAAGETTHKLPPTYTQSLQDPSGRLLPADVESISFSSNGSWMVASIPGVGIARVNTATYEVLPFGDSVSYNIGIGTAFKTAVSPDGRYAVVASMNFNIFKLYDLSTCGTVPSVITSKVTCQFKDLLPFMSQTVPSFRSVIYLRFHGEYTLDLYTSNYAGTSIVYSHRVLVAAGQQKSQFDYLALGDSFASGEGAYQYKSATDTPQNTCHLSQRSYPYLLSSELGFGKYESISCSGAIIEDLTRTDNEYKGQVKDNIPRFARETDQILENFAVGQIAQIEFILKYYPNTLTVSTVGNDIGFSDKIKRCLDTDTCYSSYEDRLEIVNEVNAQFYRLTGAYSELRKAGRPDMRLYVIGYPQIGDPDGNCALNVHLNKEELTFAQQLITYLNQMIKTAAANQGVFYVDVEDAFAGHKLCETSSWDVAVNGLTAGNDIINIPFAHGPIGNESYHPNALGHQLLKNAILAKTSNLTAVMPPPNLNSVMPEINDNLPILQAPKANRPIKTIRNVTGTNNGILQTGVNWYTKVSGIGNVLKTGSSLLGWLHSTPTDLGVFSPNNDGSVDLNITLPTSVQPGWHTLHLYGKNTSDEDVDFYMTVFVTDGQVTPCSPTNIDSDKDGTQDTCDGFIDQTPVEPEPVDFIEEPFAKPVENNPETVAGNQHIRITTGSVESHGSQEPTTKTRPDTRDSTDQKNPKQGHVAAATVEKTAQNQPETRKNSNISQIFNYLLLLFLTIGLFAVITRNHYFTK